MSATKAGRARASIWVSRAIAKDTKGLGSQAAHNSRRQGNGFFGCRVDPAEQEQLRIDRGRRKAQRRKDRKAGIRA